MRGADDVIFYNQSRDVCRSEFFGAINDNSSINRLQLNECTFLPDCLCFLDLYSGGYEPESFRRVLCQRNCPGTRLWHGCLMKMWRFHLWSRTDWSVWPGYVQWKHFVMALVKISVIVDWRDVPVTRYLHKWFAGTPLSLTFWIMNFLALWCLLVKIPERSIIRFMKLDILFTLTGPHRDHKSF